MLRTVRFPVARPRAALRISTNVALTLRYDLNPYWLLKVEGHFMHGTAGLTRPLNDNQSLSSLTKDWGRAAPQDYGLLLSG